MPSEDIANILLSEKTKTTGTIQSQFCVCVKIYIAKKKAHKKLYQCFGVVLIYTFIFYLYI